MDNININLKKRIMRRVYFYWFVRSVYAKAILLGGVVAMSAYHISFVDVAKNTSHNSGLAAFRYLMSSFVAADVASKLILTAITLGALMIGWEIVKKKSVRQVAEMRFR